MVLCLLFRKSAAIRSGLAEVVFPWLISARNELHRPLDPFQGLNARVHRRQKGAIDHHRILFYLYVWWENWSLGRSGLFFRSFFSDCFYLRARAGAGLRLLLFCASKTSCLFSFSLSPSSYLLRRARSCEFAEEDVRSAASRAARRRRVRRSLCLFKQFSEFENHNEHRF